MSQIKQLLNQGTQLLQRGLFSQAIQIFRVILQQEADNGDALHFLGLALCQTGKVQEGIPLIEKAIKANPSHAPHYHNNLGNLYKLMKHIEKASHHYQQAIQLNPQYAMAHYNLGYIHQDSNPTLALKYYQQAIQLNPQLVDAHYNSGLIYQSHGQLNEAIQSFQSALKLKPGFTPVLNSLGILAQKQGLLKEAQAYYQEALRHQPSSVEAHHNLGHLYEAREEFQQAILSYQQVLKLSKQAPLTHNNLGNIFMNKQQINTAIEHYKTAIKQKPDYSQAHANLAYALHQNHQLEEAYQHYQQALNLNPHLYQAKNNLGLVLKEMGQHIAARQCFQELIKQVPTMSQAQTNLGIVLQEQGQLENAIYHFQKALKVDEKDAQAHNNLGFIYNIQGQLEQAREHLALALKHSPHSIEALTNMGNTFKFQGQPEQAINYYKQALDIDKYQPSIHSNLILAQHFSPKMTRKDLFKEFQLWEQTFAPLPASRHYTNTLNPNKRLKIGYYSPNFKAHSISDLVSLLFEHHNKEKVEIFAFSNTTQIDETSLQFEQYVDHWVNTSGLQDLTVIQLIEEEGIDILVDLTGHMSGNRLLVFAQKPAPIQVCGLGFGLTTGLKAIDYQLTDPWIVPPTWAPHNSEKLMYLSSLMRWKIPDLDLKPSQSPPILKNRFITFGSGNQCTKINQQVIDVWSKILQQQPTAKLHLKAKEFDEEASREYYLELFKKNHVQPDQIIFSGKTSKEEHIQFYDSIDIALEPFPHHGGITTFEALWMGVPVLTVDEGNRTGLGILNNLGYPELIANDLDEYIEKSLQLAKNEEQLLQYKQTLRQQLEQSNLCNGKSFAQEIENAYRIMWRIWCRKNS